MQDFDLLSDVLPPELFLKLFNTATPKYNLKNNENIVKEELQNNGLKSVIKLPHNIYFEQDENKVVTKQVIEIVYTPFSKDDIKIELQNSILTVFIGKNNKINRYIPKYLVYHGISNQAKSFSLKLLDIVDQKRISAKAEDGILTLIFPYKLETPKEKPVEIKIN